jgi:hypothetical protein
MLGRTVRARYHPRGITMGTHADDDLDLTLAGTWRKDDDATIARYTLRTGGERYEVWTDEVTARALFQLLQSLPATIGRLTRERDHLAGEAEDLTRERDALAKKHGSAAPGGRAGSGPSKAERTPASLDDVPLAMIGTFRVDDPRVKAAAKKDPLMALAVQVAKATREDASEIERARLRAMATAVSRGDLDTFWAASTERSRKKLGG